jgi:hypothetical protein
MIAGHDRAIKPSIVYGTEESLAYAFRGSADRNSRVVGIEGDDSLSGGNIACQGLKCNFDCVWSAS